MSKGQNVYAFLLVSVQRRPRTPTDLEEFPSAVYRYLSDLPLPFRAPGLPFDVLSHLTSALPFPPRMGNTPSAQHGSPARGQANGDRAHSSQITPSTTPSSSRLPNLRLPMPQRPAHISPQTSNPTSPSAQRPSSPRRRKSLELPDLNRLSFTPAAPVPTTATHTSHHLAPTTPAAGHAKSSSLSSVAVPNPASTGASPTGRWKQALGGRTSPLIGANALGVMSKLDSSVPAPKTAPIAVRQSSVSPTRLREASINPYFPVNPPPASPAKPREIVPQGADSINLLRNLEAPIEPPTKKLTPPHAPEVEPAPPPVAPTPPSQTSQEGEEEPNDGLVNVPVQWTGGGKVVYVTGNFVDNWKGRIKLKRR